VATGEKIAEVERWYRHRTDVEALNRDARLVAGRHGVSYADADPGRAGLGRPRARRRSTIPKDQLVLALEGRLDYLYGYSFVLTNNARRGGASPALWRPTVNTVWMWRWWRSRSPHGCRN
jgi:hypothetical protein